MFKCIIFLIYLFSFNSVLAEVTTAPLQRVVSASTPVSTTLSKKEASLNKTRQTRQSIELSKAKLSAQKNEQLIRRLEKLECNSSNIYASDCPKFINWCNKLESLNKRNQSSQAKLHQCQSVKTERNKLKKHISNLLIRISNYPDAPKELLNYTNYLANQGSDLVNFDPSEYDNIASKFSVYQKLTHLKREVAAYSNAPQDIIDYFYDDNLLSTYHEREFTDMRQRFYAYVEEKNQQIENERTKESLTAQASPNKRTNQAKAKKSSSSKKSTQKNSQKKTKSDGSKLSKNSAKKVKNGKKVKAPKKDKKASSSDSFDTIIWVVLTLIVFPLLFWLLIRMDNSNNKKT